MANFDDAPKAKKIQKTLEIHGHVRIDNYFWLNERENSEVIEYLNKENDYLKRKMAHTEAFQDSLFEELKARIKEDDESVPYKYNGYWYITKFEKGKNYPIYLRRKEKIDAKDELLFDCNKMAEGFAFFKLSGLNISPDNQMAAFGIDTVGRRKYAIQIKNLMTNEIFPEKLELTTGASTWANDNKTLFYARKDEQTLRSNAIFKHMLNDDPNKDKKIFVENDESYLTHVYKTKSRRFLVIGSHSITSDEYRILDANNPHGSFKLFSKREENLEFNIYHYDHQFYILTNKDGATNFKLMKTHESKTDASHWQEVISHRHDVLIEDIDVFKDFLVVSERFNGLVNINIMPWDTNEKSYYLPFDNETYTAYTVTNVEFDTNILRYGYTSLITPASIIDFNMSDQTSEIKKIAEVADGSYHQENYRTERVWAIAGDGKKIPISMVYKKNMIKDGSNPLLLYAYGSYGSTVDPSFSRNRLTLLDRGFIFAIAHIRGSEYLGRSWYEDGKLLKKKNTFTDFIDCSKFLIESKFTSSKHLYAMGGSAGGLLIGAVINMASNLFNGVVTQVPFVDVITTMLDESIPLTTGEFDEWGNPKDKEYYHYMLSYSPYDQVVTKEYPHMLVTTGYHDSQVQYWEPVKWVAKLREFKKDRNILLLKTNMDTGHGGASGRFESLKEDALEFAFLLDLEGITK